MSSFAQPRGAGRKIAVTPATTAGKGVAVDINNRMPSGLKLPGQVLSYVEYTASVTLSATTEATANSIVSADTLNYDGAPVKVEFYCPVLQVTANAAGNFATLVLYEDGVSVGKLGDGGTTSNVYLEQTVLASRRFSPSKGRHTYSVRGYRLNANSTAFAGAGGSGAYLPGYLLIARSL